MKNIFRKLKKQDLLSKSCFLSFLILAMCLTQSLGNARWADKAIGFCGGCYTRGSVSEEWVC